MAQRRGAIMKRAFVTGAGGFLGSHLVESLIKDKYLVTCLIMEKENDSLLRCYDVKVIRGDITNINFANRIPRGCTIFHCAGLTPGFRARKKDYFNVNVTGTKNLVEAGIKRKVKQFVYISSGAAVGPVGTQEKPITESSVPHPDSFYGESKLEAEKMLKNYSNKIKIVIIRPFIFFGPRMPKASSASRFFAMASKKYVPVINGGVFEICYVKNVVDGLIMGYKKSKKPYNIFNIADNKKYSFKEVVKLVNKNVRIIIIPKTLAKILAIIGDILIIKKFNTRVLGGMTGSWNASITKAERELGFKAKYTLTEGIKDTLKAKI